jgi:hypothetical protein
VAGGFPTRVLRVARAELSLRTDDDALIAASLSTRFSRARAGISQGYRPEAADQAEARRRSVRLEPCRAGRKRRPALGGMSMVLALFTGTEASRPKPDFRRSPSAGHAARSVRTRRVEGPKTSSFGATCPALDAFCGMVFSSLAKTVRLRAGTTSETLRLMQAAGRRALSASLEMLAPALSGRRAARLRPEESPLRRAFATAPRPSGVESPPPSPSEGIGRWGDRRSRAKVKVRS